MKVPSNSPVGAKMLDQKDKQGKGRHGGKERGLTQSACRSLVSCLIYHIVTPNLSLISLKDKFSI